MTDHRETGHRETDHRETGHRETDHRDYDVKVESSPGGKPMPAWARRAFAVVDWLDARLGVRFWTLAGLVVASLIFGTPHLLIQYQCYGRCDPHATEVSCQYLGVRGWQVAAPERGRCPRLRLL